MFLMKCEQGGSGKSTVVKQMRILHGDQGLTPADRQVVSIFLIIITVTKALKVISIFLIFLIIITLTKALKVI